MDVLQGQLEVLDGDLMAEVQSVSDSLFQLWCMLGRIKELQGKEFRSGAGTRFSSLLTHPRHPGQQILAPKLDLIMD